MPRHGDDARAAGTPRGPAPSAGLGASRPAPPPRDEENGSAGQELGPAPRFTLDLGWGSDDDEEAPPPPVAPAGTASPDGTGVSRRASPERQGERLHEGR